MSIDKTFAAFANRTSQAAGSPWTFCVCLLLVVGWAASGPVFKFSETWQLVINTGTTIITFLMVFLIQNTQNRDNAAIQAKLDALILTSDAENEFVGIEKMTDKELASLQSRCEARAKAHQDAHGRVIQELDRRGKTTATDAKPTRGKTSARRAPTRKAGGRKVA
jgi:low affinity Fe/Cu permease